jgi:hypothetical protein
VAFFTPFAQKQQKGEEEHLYLGLNLSFGKNSLQKANKMKTLLQHN